MVTLVSKLDASQLYSVEELLSGVEVKPAPQPELLTVIDTDTHVEIYERGGDANQFDDRLILVKRTDPQWSNTWGILKRENGAGLTGQEWTLASRSEIQQVVRDAREFRGDIYDFVKTLGKTDQQVLSGY